MDHVSLKVQVLRSGAVLPRYMSQSAAGMDLHAVLDAPLEIAPGQRALIPTGLAFAIPLGYEGQIRPRSGLALRHGVSLVNSPGTIDADYRGEVGIILINHGEDSVTIHPCDRIAQMVLSRVVQGRLMQVESLDETPRGSGGFGHTDWRNEEIDHE